MDLSGPLRIDSQGGLLPMQSAGAGRASALCADVGLQWNHASGACGCGECLCLSLPLQLLNSIKISPCWVDGTGPSRSASQQQQPAYYPACVLMSLSLLEGAPEERECFITVFALGQTTLRPVSGAPLPKWYILSLALWPA